VDVASPSGMKGLPADWEAIVKGNIKKEEVLANPKAVLDILQFSDKGFKVGPLTSASTSNSSLDKQMLSDDDLDEEKPPTPPLPSGMTAADLPDIEDQFIQESPRPPTPPLPKYDQDDEEELRALEVPPSPPSPYIPPSPPSSSILPLPPSPPLPSIPPSPPSASSPVPFSDSDSDEVPIAVRSPPPPIDDEIDISKAEWLTAGDPSVIFKHLKKIGEGSSGTVYSGTNSNNNEKIAVKTIKFEKEKLKITFKTLSQEIQMHMTTRHPNIVQYKETFLKNDELWLIMEYCNGGSLTELISFNVMTEAQISAVCKEILKALKFIHDMKRLHRDIKSDNILLTLSGEIKLADFGAATQLTEAANKRNSIVGTPYWMAPELIRAQYYSTAVDIWSLGIAILEMADGAPPYMDFPPVRALFLIATNAPPTLKHPDQWSDNFKSFLNRCLQTNPDDRSSASTLLEHPFVQQPSNLAELVPLILRSRRAVTKSH